jgi:hypothetical protein
MEKLHGKWAPLIIAALGVCLFLPLIGSFGLWDPPEVRVADLAKEVAAGSKSAVGKPPLQTWIVVAGFKVFGVGELGGRVPVALVSILALLACFYAGEGLLRRRGALIGALALLSAPAFFLGARQLTSNAAAILATTLAVGGLARAAWPRAGEADGMRLVHLAAGVVGLVLGYLSSGMMLGVAVPLTAVALAVLMAGGPTGSWAGGLVASAVTWIVVFVAWRGAMPGPGRAGGYSSLLGGQPHAGMHQTQMVSILTQIGFGLFPAVALLPLATARAVERRDGEEGRDRFGRLTLLAWAMVAYVATTLHAASMGDVAFAGAAAVCLLAGGWLDDVMDGMEPQGVAALIVGMAAAVVAHDFFLTPEKMLGAHVLEGIKWPPLNAAPYVILGLGLLWGGAMALGLASKAGDGLLSRQKLLWAGVGVGVFTTLVTTYWIVPDVSKHLSYKGLFTKYKALGGADGELGKYHVPGNLVYYAPAGKTTDIGSLPQMFEFLGKPSRVFVMCSSEDLAPIDQHAKSHQPEPLTYYVVDDSNSKVLLLSNKLDAGKADLNPLKRQIVRELPKPPQHEVHADFENKVELVGYDLPAELDRGRQFKITLYYKVKAPLEGAYKVFLHFDGPGTRFNGDHIPLESRFPTNYWVPGFYIIDEHDMEPDRATAPSGWYQIYSGMFMGDKRLKVVSGPSDGENRVKLGAVRVK